ncbi:MAG: outer membrane beta-barrel protein [Saprospiraceae bacterium]|nr:outer membrane beta-barrel protein [Saprospiraceae bacterium]
MYSQEGSQYDINATTVKTDLDYIRLLLAYNVFFGDLGDRLRPKLYIGPTLGFLIDADTEVRNQETDIMDNYKNLDIGLAAGLGFNYRIGSQQWLNFDARFQPGLTDIVENKPSGTDAIRNQAIQLSIGVAFGLY